MRESITIKLDRRRYDAVAERARQRGKTPDGYVASLIDDAMFTFDEILKPVRKKFAQGRVTAKELDDAVNAARRSILRKSRQARRK